MQMSLVGETKANKKGAEGEGKKAKWNCWGLHKEDAAQMGREGNPKLSFSLPCFWQPPLLSLSLSCFFSLLSLCADMLLSFILFISLRFAFYNKLLLCFIVSRAFAEPSDFFLPSFPCCKSQSTHTHAHTLSFFWHFWPDTFLFFWLFGRLLSTCIWVMSCLSGKRYSPHFSSQFFLFFFS